MDLSNGVFSKLFTVYCSTFEILLAMLTRLNTNIYDHKRLKTTASIEVPDQGNEVANEGNDS